jgi:ATP-dependent Clp protease ATP-binding subunit ClpX
VGIEDIIANRVGSNTVGFKANVVGRTQRRHELLEQCQPEDLIKYGLIPEFVGRLPVVATLEELDENALVQILTEPKNAITKQYQKMFEIEGCEIEFREDSLSAVAKKAMARKTGARGLRTILENTLLEIMYDLPAMDNVSKIVVDAAVIEGHAQPYVIYEGGEMQRVASDE